MWHGHVLCVVGMDQKRETLWKRNMPLELGGEGRKGKIECVPGHKGQNSQYWGICSCKAPGEVAKVKGQGKGKGGESSWGVCEKKGHMSLKAPESKNSGGKT